MNHLRPQSNYGCRIHDQYTYLGMRTLFMENDQIRISILVEKGTEIYELGLTQSNCNFLFCSNLI